MENWRTAKPEYAKHSKRARNLPQARMLRAACEIKALLHASRDCMRNQGKHDPLVIRFSCTDGYYSEAFGILRGLAALGYGYFGSTNRSAVDEGISAQPEANFRWWMAELEREVLREEGFETDHRCVYCKVKYKKDDYTLWRQRRLEDVVETMTQALWEKPENYL
jgi:hypothetical protein